MTVLKAVIPLRAKMDYRLRGNDKLAFDPDFAMAMMKWLGLIQSPTPSVMLAEAGIDSLEGEEGLPPSQ